MITSACASLASLEEPATSKMLRSSATLTPALDNQWMPFAPTLPSPDSHADVQVGVWLLVVSGFFFGVHILYGNLLGYSNSTLLFASFREKCFLKLYLQ
jgi:hypothetical protein